MRGWIKREDVGLASCKLLDRLSSVHEALRPCHFPSLSPYFLSFLRIRSFFCSVHPKFYYAGFDDELEQEVEVVRGAFMLVRKSAIDKIGFPFDPKYFVLFEDIDLCREIRRIGLKVAYVPSVSCIDYFGRSFLFQSRAWKYLQVGKSLKRYVKKWHSPLHLVWLHCVIPIGFLLRVPEWGLKDSWQALAKK